MEKFLAEYYNLVQTGLKQVVSENQEPKGLYDPMAYILCLGGKHLRPILTLMAAKAVGGSPKKAVSPALGIEVFHNFSLVHDDVMDEAPLRRGKETVHQKWDLNTAILSGDALLVRAYQLVADVPNNILKDVLSVFSKTALEVCEGQQWDVEFEGLDAVSEEAYIKMIQYKTSVLLGAALKIGALSGDANAAVQQKLYDFGLLFGTAFQIKDDLLDAFGDPDKFGKLVGGDILENKKTILWIAAKKLGAQEEIAGLDRWFSTTDKTEDKVAAVKAIFEKTGALKYVEEKMEWYFQEAIKVLTVTQEMGVNTEELLALATFIYNREN